MAWETPPTFTANSEPTAAQLNWIAKRLADSEAAAAGATLDRVRVNMEALRRDHGWSLRELSDRLAEVGHPLGPNTVWKMEKGDRGIGVDDLDALARAFDVAPEALMRVEGGDVAALAASRKPSPAAGSLDWIVKALSPDGAASVWALVRVLLKAETTQISTAYFAEMERTHDSDGPYDAEKRIAAGIPADVARREQRRRDLTVKLVEERGAVDPREVEEILDREDADRG